MLTALTCENLNEQLTPYLEGNLNRSEASAVATHLSQCPSCRENAEHLQSMQGVLGEALGPSLLNPDFPRETTNRLRAVHAESHEYQEEPFEDVRPAPASFLDNLQARLGVAPWWVVSGTFHALLFVLCMLIGLAMIGNRTEDLVIVSDLQKIKEPEQIKEKKPRDVFKKVEVDLPEEQVAETTVITHEEVEIADEVETPNESDAADTFGEDGISDVMLGGSGSVAAVGLGGGGGGAFGRPTGAGGRLRGAMRGGGNKATESAVDKALEWLAKNQEPDGSWDSVKHEARQNLHAHADTISNVGCTGFALLAFLGAGHTDRIGKYKDNVKRAIDWMMKGLDGKTRWSNAHHSNYSHGVGTLALAEAAAMCRNATIKEAAQRAINGVIEGQIKDGQSEYQAWDYKPGGRTNDTSVTGWNVMALKSAKVAGLQVEPASFEGAMRWINAAQDMKGAPADGDGEYWEGGKVWYRGTLTKPGGHQNMALTAIGALSRLFVGGENPSNPGVAGPCNLMMKHLPIKYNKSGKDENSNLYYWYYGTLTTFQKGGDHWKKWNEAMKKTLLEAQRKDGNFDGSWDPHWPCFGGRVMNTALGAMCLEVYYRYLPVLQE